MEDALTEFGGTLIIVSHDRYLLTRIPDRILELTSEGMSEYKGNFEYYVEKNVSDGDDEDNDDEGFDRSRRSAGSSGKQSELDRTLKEVRSSEAERKAKKQAEAEERRKARREEEIENRIHELEGMIADIEEEMSDPEKAADFEWMHEKSELMAAYETEISELYDKWMELQ